MRRIWLGFLAFVFIFGLAGWFGYKLYPGDNSSGYKVTNNTQPAKVISPTPVTPETIPADRTEAAPAQNATSTEPDTSPILSYLGWEARDLGDQSQACFGFSEQLPQGNEVALKSYVEITPKTPFSLAVRDSDLCVLGLDYAKEYNVALLPGLEAQSGAELQTRRDVEVTFGDKPPFISFAGEGIILPKTKQGALGIKSMNVEAVDLTLYRVNHRILSQMSPNKGSSALEGEYSYGSDGWDKKVEVWSGQVDVAKRTNKMVTTAFDLQDHINDQGPGAYIIEAKRATPDEENNRRVASAWRWIIVTDLALTSYRGKEGLTVSVRSIENARLQPGIRLDLIALNNDKLSELVTDARGRAFFPKALLDGDIAAAPKMVMAYDEHGDYAILDLARSPLDLTSLDVTGRDASGLMDIYAFTERGVYRPGQTVHMTALVRNSQAQSAFDRPVTLIVKKPNGSEVFRDVIKSNDTAGGLTFAYEVPNDAPRGQWTFNFEAEGLGEVHQIAFGVEDFVPQKLRLGIETDKSPLRLGVTRSVMLDAQFLYGAPGGGLAAEGEVRVQIDPKPFPDFADYKFGDEGERYQEQVETLDQGLTDEKGAFELALKLSGGAYESSHPLRAFVSAGAAEPGGRFVRDSIFIPVRSQDSYIGIKPEFDYYASKNRPVPISLIAMNAAGERIASTAKWTLVEEDYDYHWYREYGRWRYRRDVRDIPVTEGTIDITADQPARWSRRLTYGRYRLDITTKDGGKASYGFGVGWSRGSSATDAPDRIQIGAPDKPMRPGDKFTISLNAPYAGRGDLVIAGEAVHQVQALDIPEGASEITLPFGKSWGQSVYAMVTLYTPRSKEHAIPKRAVGLTHIKLDRDKNTLDVNILAPEKTTPRQTFDVTVNVNNIPSGQKAYLTLAAVDEGILQLTKYKSPDAAGHYFAKKAFALDVRDDYSRILDPFAAGGADRQGGDSIGGAGLTVVPTKTVAMFSGLVQVKGGKVTLPLELPDFNGELRLMVTAWSRTAVGSASQPMKVRDPVPANLALPRFLAPGDKAVATVALDNIDGAAGDYITKVTAGDIETDMESLDFTLAKGERDQAGITLTNDAIGVDTLSLSVTGPAGYQLSSDYPIETRAPYRNITAYDLTRLGPGESYMLSQDKFSGFLRNSAEFTLSVDAMPGLTPAPFLAELRRYPYGCTEQTVSTAMPLVFVEELGGFEGMSNLDQRRQVQKAITRLVARQDSDGIFGLWKAGDGYSRPWLQLYVTDFMLKAKERGFDVPDSSLKSAISAANRLSKMDQYTSLNLNFRRGSGSNDSRYRAETAAYAHYNLVQAEQGQITAIRYLHDEFSDQMSSPVALAHLGAALQGMGDTIRAKAAFDLAVKRLGNDPDRYDYYASDIRNAAAVLAIGGQEAPESAAETVIKLLAGIDPKYTNTQENAWLVRAMAELKAKAGKVNVSVRDLKLADNRMSGLEADVTGNGRLTNNGDSPVWVSLTVNGTPDKAPPAASEGFSLSKSVYTMSGKPLGGSLKHGERAIILVEADPKVSRNSMLVISDLLPAGFEIETILKPEDGKRQDGQQGAYEWLGRLTELDMSEARDDRYVASARIGRWYRDNDIRTAYIVRAVTAGEFSFPGAMVEDMYRPQRFARTELSRLTITAAGTN